MLVRRPLTLAGGLHAARVVASHPFGRQQLLQIDARIHDEREEPLPCPAMMVRGQMKIGAGPRPL